MIEGLSMSSLVDGFPASEHLTLRNVVLCDSSNQVPDDGAKLSDSCIFPPLEETKIAYHCRRQRFPYSNYYFAEHQLPSIDTFRDMRQRLKDMTLIAGHMTVKLPMTPHGIQFNDCIYTASNLSDRQIPMLVKSQQNSDTNYQPIGKTDINNTTQKPSTHFFSHRKFNIDKVNGPKGSNKLIQERAIYCSQQHIMAGNKSSDTLGCRQQSISLSSLPVYHATKTLSMIESGVDEFTFLTERDSMSQQRSSSNEILNCRTIDDALLKNWYKSLIPTLEEGQITDNSGTTTPVLTQEVPTAPDERDTTSGFSHYVDKGFATALTTGSATMTSSTTSAEEPLRQRAFYKSDYAPKVNLKKSDESQSFQKRNANLRQKIKSIPPNTLRNNKMASTIK